MINDHVCIDWYATLHDGILTQEGVLTLTPSPLSFFPLSSVVFQKILSEHSGPSSSQQNQSANTNSLLVGGRGVAVENPRSALSPLTNSLLEQLEARIKELKAWLRDTELLIFNSCLRQDKDASEQLQSFKVGKAAFQLAWCDVSDVDACWVAFISRQEQQR